MTGLVGWAFLALGLAAVVACNASARPEATLAPDAGDAGEVAVPTATVAEPEPGAPPTPTPSMEVAKPEPEPEPLDGAKPDSGGTPSTERPPHAELAGIRFSVGEISPAFEPDRTRYRLDLPLWVEHVSVEPVAGENVLGERGTKVTIAGEPFDGVPHALSLQLGNNPVTIEVAADGVEATEYTVDVYRASEVVEELYGKARIPNRGMQFGSAVSLSGTWIAVGAPGDGTSARGIDGDEAELGAPLSGAVYLLAKTSTGWDQAVFLKASNAGAEDRFGTSLALSGTTLVVGAPGEAGGSPGVDGPDNDDLPASGAAYVFELRDEGWQQTGYLKAEMPVMGDYFGQSVATDGTRVVVGAFAESNARAGVDPTDRDDVAPYSGAAYVFEKEGSTWVQASYFKASNPDPGDQFGQSVAISGDTIVVGAIGEQSDATGVGGDESKNELFTAGAAYVFQTDELGGWRQTAFLKPSNTQERMNFGSAVGIDGSTIVVGAFTEPSSGSGIDSQGGDADAEESGAVYVFDRGEAWKQTAFLKASNAAAGDRFGQALALRGDTLVVGASLESSALGGVNPSENDDSALGAGAAYVFFRTRSEDDSSTWSQGLYLKSQNAEPGDNFGLGIGFDGLQLVVGAPFEDNENGGLTMDPSPNNALPESGAIYVFR